MMALLKLLQSSTTLRPLQAAIYCWSNGCNRFYATKKTDVDTKKYSKTVLLPKTNFPAAVKPSERSQRDELIAETCGFKNLYAWQREKVKGPEFILHDGPPYANGPVHLGHAVNKILKDITIRERLLAGYKIHYVPGWDCHGLPIEAKAIGKKEKKLNPLEIREKARKFSEEAMIAQGLEFESWGVMGDWDNKYVTSSPEFVKNQLRSFQNLYDRSLVFRDLKPVYWSPGSNTALAESELEYNHNHSSLSVFVQAKLNKIPPALVKILTSVNKPSAIVSLVAWTSTVWSLPANQAVAYGDDLQYCLVEDANSDELFVVCRDLLNSLVDKLKLKPCPLATFPGKLLKGTEYEAFFEDHVPEEHKHKKQHLPLIPSSHVTNTAGTGLVHIAPGHGQQDFLLALEHKLPLYQSISENMCYTNYAPHSVQGLNILENSTRDKILTLLDADLMYSEPFTHSYPYDWRANCPVVILASRQWFLSTETLRQKAEEALTTVKMYPVPDQDPSPLLAMLRKRPYWCISRQRVWGTPIPAVFIKKTGKAIIDKDLTEHMCSLIDEKGTDFWWSCSMEEIIPISIIQKYKCKYDELELGQDILDIWVDSGLTWSCVLGAKGQSDICIEGVDQSTGWFQASLLLSTALQGRSPFKSLQTHGFVVDKNGHKMSKSLGNVIHPKDLTHGTSKQSALGMDVVRCWVASQVVDSTNIPASPGTFKAASETVSRYRTIARFLLGNVGKQVDIKQDFSQWRFIDRLMMHRLFNFQVQVNDQYCRHQLNHVVKLVSNFVSSEISADYCHLVRDRLYCSGPDTPARQQCVRVLTWTLEVFLRSIAPIMPHLAEEICMHWPERDKLFFTPGFSASATWWQPELQKIWEQLQPIRSSIFQAAGDTNLQQLGVTIEVPQNLYTILRCLQPEAESWDSELCELFQVAAVALQPIAEEEPITVDTWKSLRNQCLRCRRYTALQDCELCPRCETVLKNIKS